MDLELNYDENTDCAEQYYEEHEMDYGMSDFEYDNPEDISEDGQIGQVVYLCAVPSIQGTLEYVLPLLVLSVLFRLGPHLVKSANLLHALSSLSGLYVLQHYAPESIPILPGFVLVSYAFLRATRNRHFPWKGAFAFLPSLALILLCEYAMLPSAWHKVRGLAMVVVMKVISVGVDSSHEKANEHPAIDPLAYAGYMLCPVTSLFGPWLPLKDYLRLLTADDKDASLARPTLLRGVAFLLVAFFYLCASNCLVPLIPGLYAWVGAYRDALAFRTSHYFVSSMASAVMLVGGFPMDVARVTRPLEMELPRSLVEVVVSWNVPMHQWLKIYVFRPGRKQLGNFGGVLATYLASSLLHGLNFQLAAVLLSLGFYTYVEFQLRLVLAEVFDACIGAKTCATATHACPHSRKSTCWWVMAINLAFSLLSVFHLAYLGLMFDTSELQETGYSYEHTISKWSRFNFASHWVAFATYCVYFLVR